MVTTIAKQSTLPAGRSQGRSIPPRFSGVANSLLKPQAEQEAVVRGYRLASFIKDKAFGAKLFNKDVRMGGLSLEDVAGRLQTLIGVYLLQGYYSIKDDKHPWETNGRNAMIWVMTLLLQNMTKSESYGLNTLLFNPFMRQKGYLSTENKAMQGFLDRFRMDVDYVDLLRDAGIPIKGDELKGAQAGKKALWASSWLDANKSALLKKRYESLHQIVEEAKKSGKHKPLEALSQEERKIYETIPKFFKRINGLNGVSTAIIMGATIYLIGGVAMRIVNKVISPLDKDFKGNKDHQPGQPPKPSLFSKGHPPQDSSNTTSPASNSFTSSSTSFPIQFFQSYVSHRRTSPHSTLPGGLY